MIRYEGTLYRPPSEADSLILQATIGCSYNRCSFCGMYRDKRFRVRPLAELEAEIEWARTNGPTPLGYGDAADVVPTDVRKVFLADGDALVARPAFLSAILRRLRAAFPGLRRVSCYASPQALAARSVEDMAALREEGLTQYYLGVESGDDAALARMEKGVDAAEMIRVARKATDAGVRLSTMILLGAGGREGSAAHAAGSARVINAIAPRFVSTLVMTPVEGTPLYEQAARGEVDELDPVELARELRDFLAALDLDGAIFRSNHASNWLSVAGTLRKDQAAMVGALDAFLAAPDPRALRPAWRRGL